MNMKNLRKSRGITLIELMIVVAIVALLAAIAVHTYRNYMVRTHRAAARACLSEAAQFMERYYTSNLTYVDADFQLNCESDGGMNQHYVFAVDDATQREYTLSATPQNSQADRDGLCTTLTLEADGTRGAGDNSAATLAKCW
jgi:type IV pilus assembly protein PilE